MHISDVCNGGHFLSIVSHIYASLALYPLYPLNWGNKRVPVNTADTLFPHMTIPEHICAVPLLVLLEMYVKMTSGCYPSPSIKCDLSSTDWMISVVCLISTLPGGVTEGRCSALELFLYGEYKSLLTQICDFQPFLKTFLYMLLLLNINLTLDVAHICQCEHFFICSSFSIFFFLLFFYFIFF